MEYRWPASCSAIVVLALFFGSTITASIICIRSVSGAAGNGSVQSAAKKRKRRCKGNHPGRKIAGQLGNDGRNQPFADTGMLIAVKIVDRHNQALDSLPPPPHRRYMKARGTITALWRLPSMNWRTYRLEDFLRGRFPPSLPARDGDYYLYQVIPLKAGGKI